MSEHNKSEELPDALQAIQAERGEGDENHDEILSSLPEEDGEDDDGHDEQPEAKMNTGKKEKNRKKATQVKVPSRDKKSRIKIVLAVAFAGAIGYGLFSILQPVKPGATSSIPAFFGKTYKDDNGVEPTVTVSQLELAVSQLRKEMLTKIDSLPTHNDLNAIKRSMLDVERVQNEQRTSIAMLNQIADRPIPTALNNQDYDRQLNAFKQELDALNAYTGNVLSTTETLKEQISSLDEVKKEVQKLVNSNWATYLEVQKLKKDSEKKAIPAGTDSSEPSSQSAAEKITWNSTHSWVLKIASERFTQIYNTSTGKNLRVFEGIEIPNCGVVISVDVAARKVSTQHCTISRK
ncbi:MULTISPECIES: hypothetical protein [Pseudoalteromonas]|uniref:hypothetical protein n=1 Tax=Pseudoalteromonas TaxID=53246 RepID=UPI00158356B7|nr:MULTISPECIES: hypothetical protein [Pseudoalteromonas]MDI4652598.1 hypothetical protein [Pseudoalteromonas shioyasakiensis]NUJ38693.1 hypothetical protein [Pseudoalteromonas sp. 0303]